MIRWLYLFAGCLALALGIAGAILPLLPTVPFIIFAAFCFAQSSPRLERQLLEHPHLGPHIQRWRRNGAISRKGKRAATAAFALSALLGIVFVSWPFSLVPVAAAFIGGTWIWGRPE
ncbi:DUF454 domain-containing protein [Sphingobium sp. SCG-1]|uniref:YbaN family protein n=1 Tax=Sphingobium sp. SCG-1 TaxID=2072936 RepID=UPI000CD69AC1|nr:YbaN family protein [Sphingobium sp. SCG-1]AUW59266.1 DUF454 domain-containing protein [Sphingobium sp. SCG-1]